MSMPELSPSRSQAASDPFANTFSRREAIMIPERGTHVPTWYMPHDQPETIVVKSGGLPLRPVEASAGWKPFTVAEVAPEARWAIGADGEIMPQHEFEVAYRRKIEEFYTVQGKRFAGVLLREYVPRVEKYVSYTVDPTNPAKYKGIGHDPHPKNAAAPSVLFDTDGENPVSGEERLALLEKCYDDHRLKARLKPHEIAEVEKRRGSDPLELAMRALRAGEIDKDEYQRRVASALGTPAILQPIEPKPAKPKRAPAKKAMPCGAEIHNVQIAQHRKTCAVCAVPAV